MGPWWPWPFQVDVPVERENVFVLSLRLVRVHHLDTVVTTQIPNRTSEPSYNA